MPLKHVRTKQRKFLHFKNACRKIQDIILHRLYRDQIVLLNKDIKFINQLKIGPENDLPVSRNITKNASKYRLTETEHDMLILAMIETMRTMEICTVPREAGEKFDQGTLISVGTTTYDLATALSACETPDDVKRFIRKFKT